jgi:hypothetical protein
VTFVSAVRPRRYQRTRLVVLGGLLMVGAETRATLYGISRDMGTPDRLHAIALKDRERKYEPNIDDVVDWSQHPENIYSRPRRLHEEVGGLQEDIQPDRCLDHAKHERVVGDPMDPGRDQMRLDVNFSAACCPSAGPQVLVFSRQAFRLE